MAHYRVLVLTIGGLLAAALASPDALARKRAAPRTGRLAVTSSPAGAAVEVDGARVGTTPLDPAIDLAPGAHTVRLTRAGYLPAERTVQVEPGQAADVAVALVAAALAPEAAPPPAGAAAALPPEPEAELAPDGGGVGLHAALRLGAGSSDEAETPGTDFLALGLVLDYEAYEGLLVGATFQQRLADQVYLSRTPLGGAGLRATQEAEQIQDARLFLSYDCLATVTEAVSVEVALAPRFLNFDSQAFNAWAFAVEVGAAVGLHLVRDFHIDAGYAFAAVAASTDETLSVLGLPTFLHDFGAAMTWDFAHQGDVVLSLELRWQGQTIEFERTSRFAHGAHIGLHVTL